MPATGRAGMAVAGFALLLGWIPATPLDAAPSGGESPTRGSPASRGDATERAALEALNAEFAYLIDHGRSDEVAALFTPQGRYQTVGQPPLVGRAAIREAYAERARRGERTSRHLFLNLRLRELEDGRVGGTSILLLFAADGPPPHPADPLGVADYDDIYERGPDGRWRFASRTVTPLFSDPARTPLVLKGAPR